MGRDDGPWCAYHRVKGHHTEHFHQLKKEIEILIYKGELLLYVKDIGGTTGKKSPSRRESNSENLSIKKGKGADEVRETRVACHNLNNAWTWTLTRYFFLKEP